MNEAASLLVGDHDFRNLCKMDMAHVSNFRRLVLSSYSAEGSLRRQSHLRCRGINRERVW
jgi:tRNA U38,U39,U40 pseudouridine synthase TruA